jgi:hypothetical protein
MSYDGHARCWAATHKEVINELNGLSLEDLDEVLDLIKTLKKL